MEKLIKASGIYALVSSFAICLVWAILLGFGFIREEILAHPLQYYFLIGAEGLSACLLLISSIGLFRGSARALKLFYIAMGMLLYAVIFATGKFFNLGLPYFALLFVAVSIATTVFLIIHLIKSKE